MTDPIGGVAAHSSAAPEGLAAFGTAAIHEAIGKLGALPSAIRPAFPGAVLSGPVFPVAATPHNNVFLHDAIVAAPPGAVLVVDTGGAHEAGYWGEIMTHAAIARDLAGLVIDGCVRDGHRLAELGWPVFARGFCIRGTGKARIPSGVVGSRIRVADVHVAPGDWVVGDHDGVVVVPRDRLATAVARTAEREDEEALIIERLRQGETTLDIYGL